MILKDERTGALVGAFHLPSRKKPMIGVQEKGVLRLYGSFRNDMDALEFMEKLSAFCGASEPKEDDECRDSSCRIDWKELGIDEQN